MHNTRLHFILSGYAHRHADINMMSVGYWAESKGGSVCCSSLLHTDVLNCPWQPSKNTQHDPQSVSRVIRDGGGVVFACLCCMTAEDCCTEGGISPQKVSFCHASMLAVYANTAEVTSEKYWNCLWLKSSKIFRAKSFNLRFKHFNWKKKKCLFIQIKCVNMLNLRGVH